MPILFLSHSGADTEAARALKKRIEDSPAAKVAGLKVWFDKDNLHAGKSWQKQLAATIDKEADAFAVLFPSSLRKAKARTPCRPSPDAIKAFSTP